jgi:hypothetical protein
MLKGSKSMRIVEFTDNGLLFEMALTRKKAESVVTGLEDTLNEHLIKLMIMTTDPAASHWKREVMSYLRRIGVIRIKPENKPAPEAFYYRILFDEPFGMNEHTNVAAIIDLLSRDYKAKLGEINIDEIVDKLQSFHKRLADALGQGQLTTDESITEILNSL